MKIRKKLLTLVITLVASIFLVVPNSALANSSVSLTTNGIYLYGSVNIGSTSAFANTTASEQLYQTVDLSYTYKIAGTFDTKTIVGRDSGYKTGVNVTLGNSQIETGSVSSHARAIHTWTVDGVLQRNTSIVY